MDVKTKRESLIMHYGLCTMNYELKNENYALWTMNYEL